MVCSKNVFLTIGAIFLLCLGIPIRINKPTPYEELKLFESFLQQFHKSYDNKTEYEQRFESFRKSLATIKYLNSKRINNASALYGLTKYSDLSTNEFSNKLLQLDLNSRISNNRLKYSPVFNISATFRKKRSPYSLPLAVDWRTKGVVSGVKNQKSCGACWAFSVVENIETMFAIKTGKLQSFSVQQLIDCAGYENDGCNGGDMCSLLQWMTDEKIYLEKEESYPLHLKNEYCKMDNTQVGVQVAKFGCQSFIKNEKSMLRILSEYGPVSVAINALTWQNYLGGVIQFHCDGSLENLNHAVQIVGYDLTKQIPYYIARNSWGEEFGDNGYLYLAIGKNICGLAHEVTAVTIS